jgi:Mlc titration factor MtfA (ptsG expression regulator)
MEQDLPYGWQAILEERVPFFEQLDGPDRERFLAWLKVFAWEKHFIGAGGLEVTEEMKVVISAVAVRLVLHLDLSYYNRLTEIVVYPYTYKHPDTVGVAVLGEAHHWGVVVLSWPDVLAGLANQRDGHDTATHEFAHVLDRATGSFNGTPDLRGREDYRPWAEVMSRHFLALRDGEHCRQLLRDYGAKNEAEFFAVATEAFFENGDSMKTCAPDLYAELQRFYQWDTADERARAAAAVATGAGRE